MDPVLLDDWMLGTLHSLNSEQEFARKQVQDWMQTQAQAQLKRSELLKLLAKEKGVSLDDYQFDGNAKGFIPKPK